MRPIPALMVCLSSICVAGCADRSSTEIEVLNGRLHAEQAKNSTLAGKINDLEAAKTIAEKQASALNEKLESAQKLLSAETDTTAKLRQQLAEVTELKAAAEQKAQAAQRALAGSAARPETNAAGGLRTIEESPPGNAVPDEVRAAFHTALVWRADQIRSLEIEIRDTPTKADQRTLQAQLERLRASPLSPAPLVPADLTLGQIGPMKVENYLRVDEVVDDKTVVATPIKLAAQLSPDASQQLAAGAGLPIAPDSVAEDENPIAIHGLSTKGVVTGAKIKNLPGLYFVQKTERYGKRTIFVLAPVDPKKLHEYFDRLQNEMRAAAMPKRRAAPTVP
jgi:hypothetical protein